MSWPEAFFYSVCVVVGASLMLKAGTGVSIMWLDWQKARVTKVALKNFTDSLLQMEKDDQ
jgi:hypothetical protein